MESAGLRDGGDRGVGRRRKTLLDLLEADAGKDDARLAGRFQRLDGAVVSDQGRVSLAWMKAKDPKFPSPFRWRAAVRPISASSLRKKATLRVRRSPISADEKWAAVNDGAAMMHFRNCNGCPIVGQAPGEPEEMPGEHAPRRAGNMRT